MATIIEEQKNVKVFICGYIEDGIISNETQEKFVKAEAMLIAKGYEVFNPGTDEWRSFVLWAWRSSSNFHKKDRDPYVLITDLSRLAECDAIYILEDWSISDGAKAEISFANATGKKRLWQNYEDARLNRKEEEKVEEVWLPL